jgi:hypothetical protein
MVALEVAQEQLQGASFDKKRKLRKTLHLSSARIDCPAAAQLGGVCHHNAGL